MTSEIRDEHPYGANESECDGVEAQVAIAAADHRVGVRVVVGKRRVDDHGTDHDHEESQRCEVVEALAGLELERLHDDEHTRALRSGESESFMVLIFYANLGFCQLSFYSFYHYKL